MALYEIISPDPDSVLSGFCYLGETLMDHNPYFYLTKMVELDAYPMTT